MGYKSIHEIGKHREQSALLIANGTSVNRVLFSDFDGLNPIVFGVNSFKPVKCDYIIHYDDNIYGTPAGAYYAKKNGEKILSFDLNKHDQTDYIYSTTDFIFADSGFHLLQIVSNILEFKTIYLIGYDYNSDGNKLRWNTDNHNLLEIETYRKVIFMKSLHKYSHPYCRCAISELKNCNCKQENIFKCSEIYNINQNSALKMFNFSNLGGLNV